MESITDPLILDTLSPKELTGILINTPYQGLVELEKRSNSVYRLLSTREFWEDKLLSDYPDLEVTEEELQNPRNLYVNAEINKLEKRMESIENNSDADPRFEAINERLEVIDGKLEKLNKERAKLKEEQENIRLYYQQSKTNLQDRLERLQRELTRERMMP